MTTFVPSPPSSGGEGWGEGVRKNRNPLIDYGPYLRVISSLK